MPAKFAARGRREQGSRRQKLLQDKGWRNKLGRFHYFTHKGEDIIAMIEQWENSGQCNCEFHTSRTAEGINDLLNRKWSRRSEIRRKGMKRIDWNVQSRSDRNPVFSLLSIHRVTLAGHRDKAITRYAINSYFSMPCFSYSTNCPIKIVCNFWNQTVLIR